MVAKSKPEPRKVGRPKAERIASNFEDDVVAELLNRIENGQSLSAICQDARMPNRCSVYEWIAQDAEFDRRFREARARGVHALAEECLTIADEKAADAVAVADKRVRIDTRLRLAGKWLPTIYGDKVDVHHSGEVQHRHDLSNYTADELDALEKLVGKAAEPAGDQGGAGEAVAGSVH